MRRPAGGGHTYVTLVHDLGARKLLSATPGCGTQTLAAAATDLRAHEDDPEVIELICMDKSGGFKKMAARFLPNAAIAFDRFHMSQLANATIDEVAVTRRPTDSTSSVRAGRGSRTRPADRAPWST